MKWEKVKLGDICKYVTSGGTPKSSIKEYYEPKQIPWLKTKEVNYCRIYETEAYISKDGLDNSSAKMIPQNSVIVAMYGQGDTAGRVAINKIPLTTNQACCNLIIDETKAYYEFVYYQLVTLYEKMVSLKNGGAQPNLNAAIIKSMEIKLPPLKTQRYIADILSSYDDLIENNQKQIKLLEEAAQRLYKEWFVDLRFPGHENTKIVDGVPEGWKKNCAEKFFEITIGKTPPRTEKRCFTTGENGISWVSIADMGNSGMFVLNTAENLTEDAIKQYNVKVIPKNTVLLSFKLTVGRVAIAPTDICTNEAIAHFKGRRECEREYTYCYLKNFHYDELGSTSSISKAVNSKIIKAMPFIMPSEKLLKEYSSKTKDAFDLIICKQKIDNNLKITRDRILHKLMSGEVEV